jgi:sialate O-acetylesterase
MNSTRTHDPARWFIGIVFLLLAAAAQAELRLPAIFSDGAVLQRNTKVAVWGWADPGAAITVEFAGQEQKTAADGAGKFMIRLSNMDASASPQTLSVSSSPGERKTVKNVLVGEVWLCSGQSNMQWPVSRAQDFDKERAAADYPALRMFLTDLKANHYCPVKNPGKLG